MPPIKLAVFAYNFPHKKTQDFLLRLFVEGYPIHTVLAADPVKLNIPPASIRSKVRHSGLIHPQQVAEKIGAHYQVLPHRGADIEALLQSQRFDLGIVAGARILKKPVIDAFRIGIINFHPGLIPEARGLDAMLWSIHDDLPLGVTAHLIDEHVDAGQILVKQPIPLYPDDGYLDLSERLYDTQLDLLKPAIETACSSEPLEVVDPNSHHNRKMPAALEEETLLKNLSRYIQKHTQVSSASLPV